MPIGAAATAVGGLLGAFGIGAQQGRMNQQMRHQEKLMGIQFGNQQALNRQGAELQYDMWKKTNYPAQMKMLREAGLNPALMYGMSGGGGTTTGSQGGGSAQGGQAPLMDIGAALQSAKLGAELDAIKAQTKKTEAEADKIAGVDTKHTQQLIKKAKEETSFIWNQKDLLGYDRAMKEMENELKTAEVLAYRNNQKEWQNSLFAKVQAEGIEYRLKEAKLKLTEEQKRQVMHKIWQDWVNAGSGLLASSSFVINALKQFGYKPPKGKMTSTTKYDKDGNLIGGSDTKTWNY